MKLIDDILEKIWAKYIKYKHRKGTAITEVSYKIGREKKSFEIDGWEIELKVFKIKENYRDKFKEYQEALDEAQKRIDDKYKPMMWEYQEDIRKATLGEIERQVHKNIDKK